MKLYCFFEEITREHIERYHRCLCGLLPQPIDGTGLNANDVWDDSVLIKAYDKAVSLAKEEVAKRLSINTNHTNQYDQKKYYPASATEKKWVVGSHCRAVYSLDGRMYEAIIIKIFHDIDKCLVKFVGYGNIEKVELSSLYTSRDIKSSLEQHVTSVSSTDISKQHNANKQNNNDRAGNRHSTNDDIHSYYKSFSSNLSATSEFEMPTAPPLPPQILTQLPINSSDALSSMLMSWYISGFHTGYYHGIGQVQRLRSHEKREKAE
ncbi:survival motor neuron protein [Chelonus insularis]|uniref:survival motor neuron protein n=1 Tax=Chelonus insularis TaxID=460826 RepID=UPI00158AEF5C|nr:survival motor neuron protein [Chelonus insularis]